ncbi:MAG: SH3 domain-containing protein, partial [Gammaproteobacteria bacterium]|nr:SH3 domain-containing protein [Gammaproteobacteria bacterium]
MNRLAPCCIAAALVALASPFAASAQEAYARGPLNLRAGPSNEYPLVARLAPRQPFDVIGCTRGYGWCDIVLPDGLRGWAYAGGIEYDDGDRPLPLAAYGAAIGVPIIGFTIGNYWSNHYRDRSWYDDRRWWGGRPPPPPVVGWRPPPPER